VRQSPLRRLGTVGTPKLYMLRRWTIEQFPSARLFTCARPGRKHSRVARVDDSVVREWVHGICDLGPQPAIVSLLGLKHGASEYTSFYSFYGGWDDPTDHPGKTSFRDWLGALSPDVLVVEHPTEDFKLIPPDERDAIVIDVRDLLSKGRTVVIVDSGGETRTKQVCSHMSAKEAFPTIPTE